jgi:hypothetical protein
MVEITQILTRLLQMGTEKFKVHLAIGAKKRYEALDAFREGRYQQFQESQTRLNFERPFILSLAFYGKNEWLFCGIYRSEGHGPLINGFYHYNTTQMPDHKDLIGRLVISYDRAGAKQSYLYLENSIDRMSVLEILRHSVTLEDFPGYDEVSIPYSTLSVIINRQIRSWENALTSMKGIYLISDKVAGKMCVGSAYSGEEAIWSRWRAYVENGHGGDVELRNIIERNGRDYANNFQFTILEIFPKGITNEFVMMRENFWKEALMTRDFGYNDN